MVEGPFNSQKHLPHKTPKVLCDTKNKPHERVEWKYNIINTSKVEKTIWIKDKIANQET